MCLHYALQLRLIYANDSPADVALKQDLDALAAGYYGKFKVRTRPIRLGGRLRPACLCLHNTQSCSLIS